MRVRAKPRPRGRDENLVLQVVVDKQASERANARRGWSTTSTFPTVPTPTTRKGHEVGSRKKHWLERRDGGMDGWMDYVLGTDTVDGETRGGLRDERIADERWLNQAADVGGRSVDDPKPTAVGWAGQGSMHLLGGSSCSSLSLSLSLSERDVWTTGI
ncbi:hypothetical protein LY76DRAFT_322473 [Colletotrichum caudatum]|nr:hypothetical protein LY76DRAFT_322473 [Colletotrichum caudatum]